MNRSTSWKQNPVVYSIIALNIAVYLTINYVLYIPSLASSCFGGLQSYEVIVRGEYWRLFSSIFVHYDLSHIAFNMVALLIFGSYAEKSFGRITTLIIYLLCGLFANCVALVFAYVEGTPSYCAIGASGAILGLASATGYFMWVLWRKNRNPTAYIFARQLGIILVLQFIIDLFVPNVSMVHHLSGVIFGIIWAFLIIAVAGRKKLRY